ncbi:hypothetical protein LTR56_016662 [Elasticomyces elasticus]|nr:hypothetical protein LTR56_016662 [Elasticomyces elasticus]KAK3641557.1 hypothetical protein LTR22_016559 [Elasticomyces elasticus]KAK4921954.1 hypothetical protein LTR49_010728 [Elasticomyces elasticus]KAK5758167.1 hypothetical protein LTS12_011784 [Elasticomyces elasticus]
MKTSFLLLGLPILGWAYPGMLGVSSREEALEFLKEKREAELEERQLLSGLIGSVAQIVSDVSGLLGSVASAVNPDNKRPEPGYVFQAPKSSDSRGPCPGLNLLANYGYLPRDGHVTFDQVIEATARGFNMGADLATVLLVFTILADGDIPTQSFYLGSGPGGIGGLNRHSTAEADVSPNREDFYLGCGNNHHLSSRIFQQNVYYAATDSSKQFTLGVMSKQWAANSKFSVKNNPYLYYFPFPSIVATAAYNFYPQFFSNGTYGAGGVANYESISSIIGAQFDTKTGNFKYVPERWPAKGWYRRSTPYGAVQALTEAFTLIYPSNPISMVFPQLQGGNFDAATALCYIYQGINSITPLALAGEEQEIGAGVTWALSKLVGAGLDLTTLGCPSSTLSPNEFLYPNATQKGGPLNPPASVQSNVGNNVYGKTYFTSAPTKPKCQHSS